MGSIIEGRVSQTPQGEKIRQQNQAIAETTNTVLHRREGTIIGVHPEIGGLIRVLYDDGITKANGGGWIPVERASKIPEEWGKLRTRMRVIVEYTGTHQQLPMARVVSDESQTVSTFSFRPAENIQKLGLYKIFAPGSGGIL